ncbi:MAG TPA: NADPH:quinone oxidoreductase family protein, partial [Mycobacteriales bacterium]|nr:NADPH:quinone oxidoreductase family protein [Mycobacteriales bacterium]
VHQRDPSVLGAGECVTTRNHRRRQQLHPASRPERRETAVMQALRVHELGDPGDVLRLEDVDVPEPGAGEVRVRVHAASLNFPDVLMCRGGYQVKPPLPFTPGSEVAGVVDAVGPGVDDLHIGDRVLAVPMLGAFAEYTTARTAGGVFRIPDAMSFAAASALHVVYQTGHLALHRRAHIRPGETLLVHAGAGGVGSAAIQLGLAAGARVIATAGGPEKVEICRKLGAHLALDYREQDFVDAVKDFTGGRGADVVYDPVGGDTYDRSTKCIAFEGRILIIGFTGGRFAEARTNHVLIKNYSVVGVHWGLSRRKEPHLLAEIHADLMRLADAGAVKPLIGDIVPFDGDVPAALEALASRKTVGKIVVTR